jgi:hypothetical protein
MKIRKKRDSVDIDKKKGMKKSNKGFHPVSSLIGASHDTSHPVPMTARPEWNDPAKNDG